MKRSEKRILTTHAGSLLRPRALGEMLGRHSRHEKVDAAAMDAAILAATRHVVALQAECGIDIANNGEQARESFFTYVQHRMSGFGGESDRPGFADMIAYPSFLEMIMAQLRNRVQVDLLHAPKAIGAVKYTDRAALITRTWRPTSGRSRMPCGSNTRRSWRTDSYCKSTRPTSRWSGT
jgi:5-methyltetrahydropteroyltriglutamate--homocysteine methyltransferase